MHLIIDIETENTGADIMEDNKRIISVQIGNATEQDLYWADSTDLQWTLASAKEEIASLLSQECVFAGYNIRGFDLPLLRRFLKVEIPESNILDLCQTPMVTQLARNKNRRSLRLEEVCMECEIEVTHKQKMNEKAEKYKARQDIKDQAKAKAKEYVYTKGWSLGFSYDYVLNKIAGGNAILDAYQEFVKSGGQKDTLFYEYAVGDVVCEHRLLEAVRH